MNKTEKELWELFRKEYKCKHARFCGQNPFQVVYCERDDKLNSCRQCNIRIKKSIQKTLI